MKDCGNRYLTLGAFQVECSLPSEPDFRWRSAGCATANRLSMTPSGCYHRKRTGPIDPERTFWANKTTTEAAAWPTGTQTTESQSATLRCRLMVRYQSITDAPINASFSLTARNGFGPLMNPGATGCGIAISIARVPQVPAAVASDFTRSLVNRLCAN